MTDITNQIYAYIKPFYKIVKNMLNKFIKFKKLLFEWLYKVREITWQELAGTAKQKLLLNDSKISLLDE